MCVVLTASPNLGGMHFKRAVTTGELQCVRRTDLRSFGSNASHVSLRNDTETLFQQFMLRVRLIVGKTCATMR